ncbi:hypothetical protein ACH4UM_18825 [Streptomyces sp. NPDC020801]|uniref:hypothetical protein n=1 Tax=Streptomyces sp. NPDC020801 TaxID=3365093 RepID=UPI0037B1435B
MTFHYTDPDGDHLRVDPFPTPDGPHITIRAEDWSYGTDAIGQATVLIPVDRVEELVAGIRDTARQAAGGQP